MEGSLFPVDSFLPSFPCSSDLSSATSVLAKKGLALGRKKIPVGGGEGCSVYSFLGEESIPHSSCYAPPRPYAPVPLL